MARSTRLTLLLVVAVLLSVGWAHEPAAGGAAPASTMASMSATAAKPAGKAPAASPAAAHASAAPATSGGHGSEAPDPNEERSDQLVRGLYWTWVILIGGLVTYTTAVHIQRYMRTIACFNYETQRYFALPNVLHGNFRRYFWQAPLFRRRHHREFKLSSAVNIGTLPSRSQTFFLVAYIAASTVLTLLNVHFDKPWNVWVEQLIERTGYLAVVNMLPLFILAGRNNPLIKVTGISFDTYNLVHRWLGRTVIVTVILHGSLWVVKKYKAGGWALIAKSEKSSELILSGTVAGACFAAILFTSPSAVRHAFYETFLHLHIGLAATALGAVWFHVKEFEHPRHIIYVVVGLWVFDRGYRFLRLVYRNMGSGGTKATVEVLPGEACRITIKMARPWTFKPGQHAYIYMPSVGMWTSHPFSLAWSGVEQQITDEKGGLAFSQQDIMSMDKETMSLIVRARTGFTERLFKKADNAPSGQFTTTAFVEGPYGFQDLSSYGTVLLFAAGVGITHAVPHVRHLVNGYHDRTVAARKVVLVWVIQSPDHLEWIRPWMTSILAQPKRREVLKILLFVTRPRSTKEIHSPSSSVQMFPGKPNIAALVDQEVESAVGAVGVSVCGVGGLADDVRKACRSWMGKVEIDFQEESFSW